jgi:hypothetical protein
MSGLEESNICRLMSIRNPIENIAAVTKSIVSLSSSVVFGMAVRLASKVLLEAFLNRIVTAEIQLKRGA